MPTYRPSRKMRAWSGLTLNLANRRVRYTLSAGGPARMDAPGGSGGGSARATRAEAMERRGARPSFRRSAPTLAAAASRGPRVGRGAPVATGGGACAKTTAVAGAGTAVGTAEAGAGTAPVSGGRDVRRQIATRIAATRRAAAAPKRDVAAARRVIRLRRPPNPARRAGSRARAARARPAPRPRAREEP